MKNSADLGGCYPPRPSASVDKTLLDLQNSSSVIEMQWDPLNTYSKDGKDGFNGFNGNMNM